ncbi:MAG: YeeE/YedE thiosulfate transporter family protein [Candidatus Krumholzibacteria bacterium]|nr:YeeE/YedE thiosulfate transporter family protein [Candidatus Krumholzibacteria bacterium]
MASQTSAHWKSISWVCAGLLAAVLMTAWLTRLWVLTAPPVGFLFGFFLQRGDLCGSSAFSEVLLLRDRSKVYGLWILIVVAMLGFALLDVLDLVQLAPKQLLWLSYLAGGVVFGACGPAVIIAGPSPQGANRPPWLQRVLTRPWRPWQAGLMIGLLAGPAYLSSAASGRNYPLGVTNGVLHLQQLLIDSQKHVVWWLVLVVAALVLGAWVAGRLSGQARLLPKPPEQIVTAFVGGILVGMGAAFANGCVVGNIMSGLALMSVGMVIFTAATILANWLVTWLYLMGGAGR